MGAGDRPGATSTTSYDVASVGRDRPCLVGRPRPGTRTVGPGAGDQPPQRAGGLARGDQVAELGTEVEGGVLQVVVERAAERDDVGVVQGGRAPRADLRAQPARRG